MTTRMLKATQLDGEALVKEFVLTGNPTIKDKAVKAFLPLVKHIIGRIKIEQYGSLMKEDLYQFGIVGLLMALERYELGMGANFKTFAYRRIYGEVVDAVRRESSVSKDVYSKKKQIVETTDRLSQTLGRDPAPSEVADALGISLEQLDQILYKGEANEELSLSDNEGGEDSESLTRQEIIADESQLSPELLMSKAVLKKELFRLIKGLPEKPRLILALYYYEELTLSDIGSILGLSESRISQIVTETLKGLRTELEQLVQ